MANDLKVSVSMVGTHALADGLNKRANMQAIKTVVRFHTAQLFSLMQSHAVFTRGYSTGETRRTIRMKLSDFEGVVAPTTAYSPYVEYGTRFMAAQPFVRPAHQSQSDKFIKDLKRIVR